MPRRKSACAQRGKNDFHKEAERGAQPNVWIEITAKKACKSKINEALTYELPINKQSAASNQQYIFFQCNLIGVVSILGRYILQKDVALSWELFSTILVVDFSPQAKLKQGKKTIHRLILINSQIVQGISMTTFSINSNKYFLQIIPALTPLFKLNGK